MVSQSVSLVPATDALLPDVMALLLAQQARQCTQDSSLRRVDSPTVVERVLRAQKNEHTLVALDREGKVRGYAQPSVWELKETSILLSFLSICNGIVKTLTLPNPSDEDAHSVTMALLDALDVYWEANATTGDLLRWPSTDASWLEPMFRARGFQLDSICALRAFHLPFFSSRPTALPSQQVRAARPEDEDALVALFAEELHIHERVTPFVHSSPQVLSAFRGKLHQVWEAGALDQGAPIVLVVEQEGEVIAMAENTLLEVGREDEPGFTPPGRYWCIDNVSVKQAFQSQGIGRLLVQAIDDIRLSLPLPLDGYVLWWNPDNPKAAHFWTRLGFQPLWTTYQRLHG